MNIEGKYHFYQQCLTHDQRLQIVTLHEENVSLRNISERFDVDRRTIQRLISKYSNTNSVDDRPHPRRPRLSTEREDRSLIRMSAANPRAVARNLQQQWRRSGVQACVRTVRNRLIEAGMHGRIANKKPLLTERHRNARLVWARERVNWTVDQWRNCFFTDESPFHLIQCQQRRYVRRRGGTVMHPQHLRPTVHSSGGKIMVWGGFSGRGHRSIVRTANKINAQVYIDILRDNVLPLDFHTNNITLQHDNATAHTARRTIRFLDESNVQTLSWPPQPLI